MPDTPPGPDLPIPTQAADDTAGVLLPPPIGLVIAIGTGLALQMLWPVQYLRAGSLGIWIGGAMAAFALALEGWAIGWFMKSGTRPEPWKPTSSIVASGPYRWSRNPMYLGMLGLVAGLSVMLDNGWLILAALPLWAFLRWGVIAREEVYLERRFGRAYTDYKAIVRRWL